MNAALRVGMLAPISWRVPPRHCGPWEQFVSLLTEGLVERGVDVTLFATADSQTRARLVGSAPTGYSEDAALDAKVWECLHVATVFEQADEFDLIHNSADFSRSLGAASAPRPCRGDRYDCLIAIFSRSVRRLWHARQHPVSVGHLDSLGVDPLAAVSMLATPPAG